MRTDTDERKIRLFYCYSHVDENLRNSLEKHLSALRRTGVIDEWHDRRITAGSEWKDRIDRSLDEADVVLLLISADFLASDYCYDVEMERALERHEAEEAVVIPVIVRPVDWSDAPFGKLQALPKDARPVTSWPDQDEALTDVAKGIRTSISKLHTARRTGAATKRDSSGEGYEPEEEEGLLDLVDKGNREFKLLTEVVTSMSEAIAELGRKANVTSGRLQPDYEGKVDPARAKPIIDQMARYMSEFAAGLASRMDELAKARERGLEAVRRASELAPDFGDGGVQGLQSNNEQLDIFRASIPKTREQMESFRNTIASLPRLTTNLNRAKRASLRSLDALQEQLDLAMKDTDSVRHRIGEVLTRISNLIQTSRPSGGLERLYS